MNFFLDHDVPTDVGRVLRLKGHTVHFCKKFFLGRRVIYRHSDTQQASSWW